MATDPRATADVVPFILVVERDGVEERHSFAQSVVNVGRGLENDLVLEDRLASRRHCTLEQEGGTIYLVDAGSQNRTRLNGKVVANARIAFGDVFQVGRSRIRVERKPDPVARPPAAELEDETQVKEPAQVREDLQALSRVTKALNSEHEPRRLLTLIVDSAIELTSAERGFLVMKGDEGLTVEVARNFAQEEVDSPAFKISRTMAEEVLATGEARLTVNAQSDERWRDLQSVADLKLRSVILVPIAVRGKPEGVLYVDNRLKQHAFVEEDKDRLMILADQAGIAVHNARVMADLRRKHEALMDALARVEELNARLEGRVRDQEEEIQTIQEDLRMSRRALGLLYDYRKIIGQSRRMRDLFRILDRYIGSDDPVLIAGESGTGKELIARAIHAQGRRKDGPFVSESCAALTESLLESELFGYVKGAFTGAVSNKRGLVEAASGGTLFLDEVGEMSVDLQKKLLRVLQEGEVRPLGSNRTVKVDLRLITATNRDLEEMVREGDFREDLYYRINVLPVRVPPLRERKEDVPLLVDHVLRAAASEAGRPVPRVAPQVMNLLSAYRWPGNVRELENEMKRALILAEGEILPEHLSEAVAQGAFGGDPAEAKTPAEAGTTLPEMVKAMEIREIRKALVQAGGNKSRAAEMLGLSRFALQRKLEKFFLAEEAGQEQDPPDKDASEQEPPE